MVVLGGRIMGGICCVFRVVEVFASRKTCSKYDTSRKDLRQMVKDYSCVMGVANAQPWHPSRNLSGQAVANEDE